MAVADRLSGPITNRDAVPRVTNNAAVAAGQVRAFVGKILTVATDDIASTYRFATVPSSAVMHSLRLYSPDIGSSAAAADVGLYRTTRDGSAVVDADFFAAAINLNAGAVNGQDCLLGTSGFPLSEMEMPLWQALGLTEDPKIDYDICLTATGAIDAAVNMVLRGTYAR